MKIKYRPDIDGLRAIAVLSVLFFHTEVPGFTGGFVGVDIFFVISGFLITSILLNEINEGNYSISRFYERRIRRIFPALFPVIIFTIIVGAVLFTPDGYKKLSETTLSTTLFYSNYLFANQSGYFDAPSIEKPLLHTWSLALEEQFYIFFPLLLVFINRFKKNRYIPWLLLIFCISLAASIYGVAYYPSKTFYLLYTRAWELLAGSIVAVGFIPIPSKVLLRNFLSVIGFGFIVYSICFYTESTLFPGYNAIAPVLGTCMIIFSYKDCEAGVLNKILSFNPLVSIGLISYSLYLWHWPFIAFAKYLIFRPFTSLEKLFIIIASIAVSILSWKYIEQPFRRKYLLLPDRNKLFALSGVVMIVIAGVSVAIYNLKGLPERIDSNINATISKAHLDWEKEDEFRKCIEQNNYAKIMPPVIGEKNLTPQFILWGDSHAYALKNGVSYIARKYNISGFLANISGCPPILDTGSMDPSKNGDIILTIIKNHPTIRTIILASRWAAHFNGCGYKDDLIKVNKQNGEKSYNALHSGLSRTVHALLAMGCNVVLVSDVPEIGHDVPRWYVIHERFPMIANEIRPTLSEYNERQQKAQLVLNELAQLPGVIIIHPESKLFDNDARARVIYNGQLLYWDDSHLSSFGSLYVASVFDQVFKQMAKNSK